MRNTCSCSSIISVLLSCSSIIKYSRRDHKVMWILTAAQFISLWRPISKAFVDLLDKWLESQQIYRILGPKNRFTPTTTIQWRGEKGYLRLERETNNYCTEWSEPCQDLEASKWPWTWPIERQHLGRIYYSSNMVSAEDVHTSSSCKHQTCY